MAKVVGIDLGTTNSCVAVMEGGSPQLLPTPKVFGQRHQLLPLQKNGDRLVGQIAKRLR